jgi:hypothetical protein
MSLCTGRTGEILDYATGRIFLTFMRTRAYLVFERCHCSPGLESLAADHDGDRES